MDYNKRVARAVVPLFFIAKKPSLPSTSSSWLAFGSREARLDWCFFVRVGSSFDELDYPHLVAIP
jgi:hypothetical protein